MIEQVKQKLHYLGKIKIRFRKPKRKREKRGKLEGQIIRRKIISLEIHDGKEKDVTDKKITDNQLTIVGKKSDGAKIPKEEQI